MALPPPHPPKNRYDIVCSSPTPPELPAKPKKNILKSPLKAIKNAFVKSTKSLRRQASFMEPSESKKQKAALRRQHSMMERGTNRTFYSSPNQPNDSNHQNYYEYQQQQYHDYYYQQQQQQQHQQQHPSQQRFNPQDDPRYMYYQRQDTFYPKNQYGDEPIYGNYQDETDAQENLYANRALIELERTAPVQSKTGGRIVRRHSMNEHQKGLPPAFATLTKRRYKYPDDEYTQGAHIIDEPVYQSKRGSYMYQEQMKPKYHPDPSQHEMRRKNFFEKPIEDSEKLLQARKDLHSNSPGTSAASTPSSSSSSKERNLRDSRRQLKEQIYQSRLDAMQSMAEPIYITKSSSGTSSGNGNLRSQPIYESKKECEEYDHDKSKDASEEGDTSNENNENEKSLLEAIEETILKNQSQDHLNDFTTENGHTTQEIPFFDDTIDSSENNTIVNMAIEQTIVESCNSPTTQRPLRAPFHISNIIKRTAPPPPPLRSPNTVATSQFNNHNNNGDAIYESHTSIETQYASQASLPIGPPNAQSTPYNSELTLKEQRQQAKARFLSAPAVKQPVTTRGIFDENGGILEDKVWNVSLIIPPNALPVGIKQEIYFTVTDPRMSETVGGPPLDMENGW